MKKTISFFLSALLLSSFLSADAKQDDVKNYLELLKEYPNILGPWGNWQQGEIEIIRDPVKIQQIQEKTTNKIGVMAKNQYWLWVNDPVQFPSGTTGVYGRIIWTKSLQGAGGVAAMALLPDGRIVLNCNFRHATRSWELELPRGGMNVGETFEEAAKREVKEETGMIVADLHSLGVMTPDSGLTNTVAPIFLAKVIKEEKATPEDSEAIAAIQAFSLSDLKKAFIKGSITLEIEGKKKEVFVRDPFLAYALFKAEIMGLLKEEKNGWNSQQPQPASSSLSSP